VQVSSENPHDCDPEAGLGIVNRLSRRGSTGSVASLGSSAQDLAMTAGSFEAQCARLAACGVGAGTASGACVLVGSCWRIVTSSGTP
jgi:hypothetical protein